MNDVLLVACHRGGHCFKAFSALYSLGRNCLWTASSTNTDRRDRSRLPCGGFKQSCSIFSAQGQHHAVVRKESLTSLIFRSPFHSSTINPRAKRPSIRPALQPAQPHPTVTSSKPPSQGHDSASPTQELTPKSRYKKSIQQYQPSHDLNPSGKPIYPGTEEWFNCIKSTTLKPNPTPEEVKKIFGDVIPVEDATKILKVLQYQRLSGTLDHSLSLPQLTDNLIAEALQYLREKHPFDEDAAILARIQREYDAENPDTDSLDGKPAYVPQQGAEETGIYGKPGLDAIVAEKKAALEHKAAAEKAEQEAKQGAPTSVPVVRKTWPERIAEAQKQESAEWVKRYKEKAQLSSGPPPEMPMRKRLLPCAIFTLVTVACCYVLAEYYIPPARATRLFPDTPPAAATVLTLIGMNVAVFIAWRIPPLWRFMNKHFILVAGQPRVTSLLGAMFSHHQFLHLAVNMTVLWLIGTWLHDDIGRGRFIATYIAGGVCTSFLALFVFLWNGHLRISTLGASGAVLALIGARCVLYAGASFQVPFLPEDSLVRVPALGSLAMLVFLEAAGLYRQKEGIGFGVDRVSHLVALLFGANMGVLLHWKMHQLGRRAVYRPGRPLSDLWTTKGAEKGGYSATVSKPIIEQPRPLAPPQLRPLAQPQPPPQAQSRSPAESMKWEERKGW